MRQHPNISSRVEDGYFYVTDFSKANSKNPNDWARLKETEEVVSSLAVELGIPPTSLVQTHRVGDERGAWIHPKLIASFLFWVSPEYTLDIAELLFNPPQPATKLPHTLRERVLEELARRDLSTVPTDKLIRLLD